MGFLSFLAEKKFYISLGLSVIVTLILLLLLFMFIKSYTRHGDAMVLPDFRGLTMRDLHQKQYDDQFDFVITDSVFANDQEPGSIVKQNPSPGSWVKEGRNVYITLVAMAPEMTSMPDLKDLTIRQAVSSLNNRGLKINNLRYIPDMADNAVLGHYFNGDTLRAGDELLSGSAIDLLIGLSNNNPSPVPFLIGLTEEAARDLIFISGFNVGRINVRDSMALKDGRVYLQSPGWSSSLLRGETVELWLRSARLYDFDSLIRVIVPDSAVMEEVIPEFPGDTDIFEE